MQYLVSVDHNGMAVDLTRSDYEGFQEVLYIQFIWMGLLVVWCGMTSVDDEDLRSECQDDEDTNCEDGDSDTDW